MANLYEYLVENDPACIELLIGSVINKLLIPASWRPDVRQQILLAWYECNYDARRVHGEILSYAHSRAFFAASEWRRRVVLPVALHRSSGAHEPLSISYEATFAASDTEPVAKGAEQNLHQATPDEIVEFASAAALHPDDITALADQEAFTAHCIELPSGNQSKNRVTNEHLVAFISEGLSIGEISAVTRLAERSIYRRLSAIKSANRYAV